MLQLGRINEGLLNVDISQSPSHSRYHAGATQACTLRDNGCSWCTIAASFPSKDQCFLQGIEKGPRAPVRVNQAGLNFLVRSEGDDHASVSRSDRTLNVYNYVLQMHLCLELFPGCLSGSTLEIPSLAEQVSYWSLFFQNRTAAGRIYCFCLTQLRKHC